MAAGDDDAVEQLGPGRRFDPVALAFGGDCGNATVEADAAGQVTVGEHDAIDIVEPERLSGRVQSMETSRHVFG